MRLHSSRLANYDQKRPRCICEAIIIYYHASQRPVEIWVCYYGHYYRSLPVSSGVRLWCHHITKQVVARPGICKQRRRDLWAAHTVWWDAYVAIPLPQYWHAQQRSQSCCISIAKYWARPSVLYGHNDSHRWCNEVSTVWNLFEQFYICVKLIWAILHFGAHLV